MSDFKLAILIIGGVLAFIIVIILGYALEARQRADCFAANAHRTVAEASLLCGKAR